MINLDPIAGAAPAGMPRFAAADLQEQLLVASQDLDRLQRLLDDAGQSLMGHFTGATARLDAVLRDLQALQAPDVETVRDTKLTLAGAITALQFHDMATQLIEHTTRRLRNCAGRLAGRAPGGDEACCAVVEHRLLRSNPVTQEEIDAGSIELF